MKGGGSADDEEVADAPGGRSVAAAVLAGGAARRMGGEKAGAVLADRPLISYPLAALRRAGLDPFVVTKHDRPVDRIPGLGDVKVVIEPALPRHPLLGVLKALRHADGRPVVVLGCDMPLLPPELLRWLAAQPGGTVVPRVGGYLQPLAARYGSDAVAAVKRGVELDASVTGVISGLDAAVIEEASLSRFGNPERIFTNVNTPDDLAAIERIVTATGPEPRD